MARHVSSCEYKYIPLDNVLKIAELEEKIRKQDKQIRELLRTKIRRKQNENNIQKQINKNIQ